MYIHLIRPIKKLSLEINAAQNTETSLSVMDLFLLFFSSYGMKYVIKFCTLFYNINFIKMAKKTTKTSETPHGKLDAADKKKLDDKDYAFPKQRKEPLEDASHVRNAMARFDQVKDVTDAERKEAFEKIKKAAKKFGVAVNEKDWKELAHKK